MHRWIPARPTRITPGVASDTFDDELNLCLVAPSLAYEIRNHVVVNQTSATTEINEGVDVRREIWRANDRDIPDEPVVVDLHVAPASEARVGSVGQDSRVRERVVPNDCPGVVVDVHRLKYVYKSVRLNVEVLIAVRVRGAEL